MFHVRASIGIVIDRGSDPTNILVSVEGTDPMPSRTPAATSVDPNCEGSVINRLSLVADVRTRCFYWTSSQRSRTRANRSDRYRFDLLQIDMRLGCL
jgi:hypothetical protein